MEHKLVLFYLNTCPFCHRVQDYLQRRNIEIPQREIDEDAQAAAELARVGGKTQVPCLFVDGVPMYESMDIIDWFEKNWPQS